MVKDGLFTRFPKPDFVVGLHDVQLLPSGEIGVIAGPAMAASNAVDITFYGQGGHGATPQRTIDPIVMAARTVVTLQTIVSRETSPFDPAVVTVGTFHAGTKRNIIPDEAKIELTVRSFKPEVQKRSSPPSSASPRRRRRRRARPRSPPFVDSPGRPPRSSTTIRRSPSEWRPCCASSSARPTSSTVRAERASEDFGVYGRTAGVPSVVLRIGASEPGEFEKLKAVGKVPPGPHTAKFAPDRERTIRTGVTLTSRRPRARSPRRRSAKRGPSPRRMRQMPHVPGRPEARS